MSRAFQSPRQAVRSQIVVLRGRIRPQVREQRRPALDDALSLALNVLAQRLDERPVIQIDRPDHDPSRLSVSSKK